MRWKKLGASVQAGTLRCVLRYLRIRGIEELVLLDLPSQQLHGVRAIQIQGRAVWPGQPTEGPTGVHLHPVRQPTQLHGETGRGGGAIAPPYGVQRQPGVVQSCRSGQRREDCRSRGALVQRRGAFVIVPQQLDGDRQRPMLIGMQVA